MIKTKAFPISLIVIVILLRAVVLEQYYTYFNEKTVWLIVKGIFFSPLIAFPASLIVFFFVVRTLNGKVKLMIKEYFSIIGYWALIGLGVAFVVIVTLTIISNSSQGPLALIIDGPLGVSSGILIGTGIWVKQNIKPNNSLQ